MSADAATLIETATREGRLRRAKARVASLAEFALLGEAVERRHGAAVLARLGDVELLTNLHADRRRLALALDGAADKLPLELIARLAKPIAAREAPAPWSRPGDGLLAALSANGTLFAGLACLAPGEEAPIAWLSARGTGAGTIALGPVPRRLRERLGKTLCLAIGAPLAACAAAALNGARGATGYGEAGAMARGSLAAARTPSGFVAPADSAMILEGTLAADGIFAPTRTALVPGAPVVLATGIHASRDFLAIEALGIEIALAAHLRNVEGGLDLFDVRVMPESENRLAVVKLRPRVGGQSKTAMMAALSSPDLRPDLVIGVDDDIRLDDPRDIAWTWASRVHALVDIQRIDGLPMSEYDGKPPVKDRGLVGAKWFVDATMPPITQPQRRAAFMRAIPKNLDKVELAPFLPPGFNRR